MRETIQNSFSVLWVVVLLNVSTSYADWQSPYYLDHPLVGKIYSLTENAFINEDQLASEITETNYLLLGEKHSNADHHIGQARLIKGWLDERSSVAIALEMLETDAWPHAGRIWQNAEELNASLEKSAARWDWEIYRPIVDLAVSHRLPIYASNLSRKTLQEYAQGEQCELVRNEKSITFCDTIKAAEYEAINQLIFDAHCGYVPKDQLRPLVQMQIARDASFALSMLTVNNQQKVVLITGGVHARKDIGVPVHLETLGVDSISIAFVNVDPAREEPQEYLIDSLSQPYDYIIFTPSETDVDPCVKFAEQLKSINKH